MATLKLAMFFAGRRFVLTIFNPLALSDCPVFKGYEHIRCFEQEPVSLQRKIWYIRSNECEEGSGQRLCV